MRRSLPVLLVMVVGTQLGCATGSTRERCEGITCGHRDGSVPRDAAADAAGDGDGGAIDGSASDAGANDAGAIDGGAIDAGLADAGAVDAGTCAGGPCDLWVLPHRAARWSPVTRGTGPFAPTTPIRAAFDVEALGQAWVLTDGTYHVMRLSDRAWIAAGTRNTLFPEASGAALRTALSLPYPHGGGYEIVFLSSATAVYHYDVQWADGQIVFREITTEFGPEWSAPNAPVRARIRFDWFDDLNDRGWASVDPSTLCDTTLTALGAYGVYVTDTHTHLQDGLACFQFFRRDPLPSFAPLALPGAPDAAVIGAAFQHGGALYLFAE